MSGSSHQAVGAIVGTLLILVHAAALLQKDCSQWIQKFPRSRTWGTALLLMAATWTFFLVRRMDLGEFANLRTIALGSVVLAALLTWLFLEEFLAARSTGFLALLAADPILNSCILWPLNYRLPLVVLAYICILCGVVWAGMPYLMRDQIAWLTASSWRWNIAAGVGVVVGCIILSCSFLGT
ncbi:hypothetical protein AMD24_00530 [Candidatus Xiphinematobacter sp. Idaho Grape]|uniref:hypothetical protein n=1 Tax=Candidatus Xiphinematobacter sp. Idaho Grape TaxID=1704307 RepID=UPI00070577F7|nr:hypothetical protein [Candidatus Xiphinematobacter sp. Idaho Grape]ALJ56702.1 hypothetical protein AMD24_00530 [Candidatus Xiphinematobacter sp. Idaho Grape]